MNRIDYSIEVKIVRPDKEKVFNIPFVCDNQVWFQIFKAEGLGHSFEVPIANVKLKR
jgi:hypothetical protein